MIYSMTGFATRLFTITQPSGERSTISISIKTLNSRFFESTIKLPMPLSHLETPIIKLCKEKLRRGNLYFTAHVSNPAIFEGSITPSFNLIDQYIAALEHIKNNYKITDEIKIDNILRLPNIFSKQEQPVDQSINKEILTIVSQLLETVTNERFTEGSKLAEDIKNRIKIINNEIKIITDRATSFINEWKDKVRITIQDIGADDNLLVNAQKNGLYSMLDKIDIHEEIIRFNSHMEHFIKHLNTTDMEKAKRLDFTLQELAREINTITAKCSDSTISIHAINIKVEIEKMREQIQNIV